MSERRKENWIYIYTPDGERRIASPDNVKGLLGLGAVLSRLRTLEMKIERLESPLRQEKIIETLRGQGPHTRDWLFNRCDLRWDDLGVLIKKGIIIESRSGTHRMIELNEELDRKC